MTRKITPSVHVPHAERTVKAMLAEIAKMQEFVLQPANYDNGYDTMAECWDDEDYEKLFYEGEFTAPVVNGKPVPRRVTFAMAWETLHSVASIFAERQADADYYASTDTDIPCREDAGFTPAAIDPVTVRSRDAADTPDGAAAAGARPAPRYTGDKIIGIATMHKSNLVPVFSHEQAVDTAQMRRG